MRMPFGKYQDKELTDIPRPYLIWLRRQQWLGAWLAKEIDAVLSSANIALRLGDPEAADKVRRISERLLAGT